MFNFGVVLYKTPVRDIQRIFKSIDAACQLADIDYTLTFLRNSDEPLNLPAEMAQSVDVIEFTQNLGFGKGHNKIAFSLQERTGFYVGLNPDGFLSPWAMQAVASRNLLPTNLYEFLQTPQEHPKKFDPMSGSSSWSSGAAFLIDLTFFRNLGGFDECFFMYCEDVDLSWRIRATGGECIVMPDALFFHDVSDNRDSPKTVSQTLVAQVQLARMWGRPKVARDIEKKLRGIEAKYDLPKTTIPEVSSCKIRKKKHRFLDFRNAASYSVTRW